MLFWSSKEQYQEESEFVDCRVYSGKTVGQMLRQIVYNQGVGYQYETYAATMSPHLLL